MHRVAHLSSAHPRYDTRIFVKMCQSLVRYGYEVSLIVADDKGNEEKNGVRIFDVGTSGHGRFARITRTVDKVFAEAKDLDADIYHLHDPELMLVGKKLKALGKKVVFDAHEDFPTQILAKYYLNPLIRHAMSLASRYVERYLCAKFDAIVSATPTINEKFLTINPVSVDINNFPLLEEFNFEIDWHEKKNQIAYVGGIVKIRGIEEIVLALDYVGDARLNLAGRFSERETEKKVKSMPSWRRVIEHGFANRNEVQKILSKSRIGLVTLHPTANYIDSLPVKMFEYMAAGIPVIASNFPLWRKIIESENCGVCVDPLNPQAIGANIQFLLDHPIEAEKMGQNGRRAIIEKYNWSTEEKKLYALYETLLNPVEN